MSGAHAHLPPKQTVTSSSKMEDAGGKLSHQSHYKCEIRVNYTVKSWIQGVESFFYFCWINICKFNIVSHRLFAVISMRKGCFVASGAGKCYFTHEAPVRSCQTAARFTTLCYLAERPRQQRYPTITKQRAV